jgi:hypothetical protein
VWKKRLIRQDFLALVGVHTTICRHYISAIKTCKIATNRKKSATSLVFGVLIAVVVIFMEDIIPLHSILKPPTRVFHNSPFRVRHVRHVHFEMPPNAPKRSRETTNNSRDKTIQQGRTRQGRLKD